MSKADRGIDNTMPPIFNRRKTSMFDNIDSRARIEREIGKRIEAAKCSRGMNSQPRNENKGKL